jgi:Flp pilus assembly protein CpaB
MNKNVMIVLIGGFVIAILVAVLVQASLGGKSEDTGDKIQVLVAAKDLPLGSNLTAGDLKWQTWPGQPFAGAIVREKEQKAEEPWQLYF